MGFAKGSRSSPPTSSIRAVILAGQSEKSMIGGADIKEMAKLDQKSAEAFITRLRDLCEAVRNFPAPVIARLPGWWPRRWTGGRRRLRFPGRGP